jgi:hypothetical protein
LLGAFFAIYWSCSAARADVLARSGNVAQAVRLAPGNANYWMALANLKELQDSAAEDELDRARRLNPLNWDIWIQSGLRAEGRGELARAEAFLLQAELLNRQCWPQTILANFYFRTGNHSHFWPRVRIALACTTEDRRPLFDLCWNLSGNAGFILREAIPNSPAARRDFLQYLLSHNLLDAAEIAGPAVAAGAETAEREVLLRYTDRMADAGRWGAALAGWNALCARRILPYAALDGERGPWLTNGMFAAQPLNAGFDWQVREVAGVSVSRRRSPDALRIEFSGQQPEECEILRQFIPVLQLRSYTLLGMHKLSGIGSGTGLNLRLTDAGKGDEIAKAELVGDSTQLHFKVSEKVSVVRLSLGYRRMPGTIRIQGSIVLTGFRLEVDR